MENVYKFVKWDVPALETLKDSTAYKTMEALQNGEKTSIYAESGTVKLMGWLFDFRPYMKKYVVKIKYYGWQEMYAFNKTAIRKNYVIPSHVLQIVEI
jgi:hypothetical protein